MRQHSEALVVGGDNKGGGIVPIDWGGPLFKLDGARWGHLGIRRPQNEAINCISHGSFECDIKTMKKRDLQARSDVCTYLQLEDLLRDWWTAHASWVFNSTLEQFICKLTLIRDGPGVKYTQYL